MKNYVLKFGSLAGLILVAFILIGPVSNVCGENMTLSMIIGFTGMTIAFSMAYFAVKAYRDKELGGVISFGRALWTSLLLTFFASLFYVLSWGIYFYGFNPSWGEEYAKVYAKEVENDDSLSDEEKAKKIKDSDEMMENYSEPGYFFLITYSEPMLPAIGVSLIVALVTMRKKEE